MRKHIALNGREVYGEWKEHHGERCPMKDDTLVQILFGNGFSWVTNSPQDVGWEDFYPDTGIGLNVKKYRTIHYEVLGDLGQT